MAESFRIPPGSPPPNYVNPPTQPPAPEIVAAVFAFSVITTTCLRLYTRLRVSSYLGLDDLFAVGGCVCSYKIPNYISINRPDRELTVVI